MYTIKDICENITSGQIMSRVTESEQISINSDSVKLIIPKAISHGRVDHNELGDAQIIKAVDESKIARSGDIVVKLSTPYESALIDNSSDGLIVTSFCALIHGISQTIIPEFLVAYLNTARVREQLKQSTAGSSVPLLRVNDLKKLEVPMVPISVQQAVVEAIKLNTEKRITLEKMIKNCEALEESIITSAIAMEVTS